MRRFVIGLWLLLVVYPLQAQSTPTYFVEATISNPTPYVGQQTVYNFRLYTTTLVDNLIYTAPDFEGLWRTSMGPQTDFNAQVNGQTYSVSQLQTALFPTYAGENTIEPAELLLPVSVFRDEEILQTASVSIVALPLPDGAPADFSGAVGQFSMTASLDRQSAALGEPLRLALTIRGTGNVEQLPAPALPVPADWGVYPNPTTYRSSVENGLLVGEKTFEWLLTPAEVGQPTLPQITLSYFDPDPAVMGYRAVSTSSITLDILPGTPGQAVPTSNPNPTTLTLLPLKPIPASLQVGFSDLGAFFWLLWLFPPIGAVGAWLYMRQKQIEIRTRTQRQASGALAQAQTALQTARKAAPDVAYRAITAAIYAYFGAKLQRQAAGLSQADLRAALDARLVPAPVIDSLFWCLEAADTGRYAPAGAADLQSLVERTLKTLAAVDAGWK